MNEGTYFCEECDCLFGIGNAVVSKHVFGAFVVDEPILQVEFTRFVHGFHGGDRVSSMLI